MRKFEITFHPSPRKKKTSSFVLLGGSVPRSRGRSFASVWAHGVEVEEMRSKGTVGVLQPDFL